MMERLVRNDEIEYAIDEMKEYECSGFSDWHIPSIASFYKTKMALEELKSYREAEEQGLLLRLPCKVGDTVWYIDNYGLFEPTITRGIVYGYLWYRTCGFALDVVWDKPIMEHFSYRRKEMPFSSIGKDVFLTKEEAERKLQEMKGE